MRISASRFTSIIRDNDATDTHKRARDDNSIERWQSVSLLASPSAFKQPAPASAFKQPAPVDASKIKQPIAMRGWAITPRLIDNIPRDPLIFDTQTAPRSTAERASGMPPENLEQWAITQDLNAPLALALNGPHALLRSINADLMPSICTDQMSILYSLPAPLTNNGSRSPSISFSPVVSDPMPIATQPTQSTQQQPDDFGVDYHFDPQSLSLSPSPVPVSDPQQQQQQQQQQQPQTVPWNHASLVWINTSAPKVKVLARKNGAGFCTYYKSQTKVSSSLARDAIPLFRGVNMYCSDMFKQCKERRLAQHPEFFGYALTPKRWTVIKACKHRTIEHKAKLTRRLNDEGIENTPGS